MTEDVPDRTEIDRFIVDRIDSVPHLEALLLLWRQRPESWTAEVIAKRLWIKVEAARNILQDLARDNLLVLNAGEQEQYSYRSGPNDNLMVRVADAYRHEMIRISNMIHAKPSSAVRAFARAFRFTKEQE